MAPVGFEVSNRDRETVETFLSNRDREIVEAFCCGDAPSKIDADMMLVPGTSRAAIVGWWYDDNIGRGEESERWRTERDYSLIF